VREPVPSMRSITIDGADKSGIAQCPSLTKLEGLNPEIVAAIS